MQNTLLTISDLMREFDISARTIRFYEEKGLIMPTRTPGNQRRYTPTDRNRLKWILRGKRFGYSLEEIARMLNLVDAKTDAADQIRTTLKYGNAKLKDIENHIEELQCMREDLLTLKRKLTNRLATMETNKENCNA